ncbi:MAG: ATP-binding cassette domain-containing protein, partial [Candidatus Aminicenantes bacterium]
MGKKGLSGKKGSSRSLSRRDFLTGGAAAAAGMMIVPRRVLGGGGMSPPSDTLNIASIGVGGKGSSDIRSVSTENIAALCDVDDVQMRDFLNSGQNMPERADLTDFLDREVNYGFSGGEIKRSELMQLLAQKPQLVLLDEPESGVDLVNVALIAKLIDELLEKDCRIVERKCSGLIITHTGHILDYIDARTGYVMCEGRIGCEADPHEILKTVKEKGYEECI